MTSNEAGFLNRELRQESQSYRDIAKDLVLPLVEQQLDRTLMRRNSHLPGQLAVMLTMAAAASAGVAIAHDGRFFTNERANVLAMAAIESANSASDTHDEAFVKALHLFLQHEGIMSGSMLYDNVLHVMITCLDFLAGESVQIKHGDEKLLAMLKQVKQQHQPRRRMPRWVNALCALIPKRRAA